MKRWILLLLAGLFLFTACGEPVSQITSEVSEESKTETSGERQYTLVSVGKPYTKSNPANKTYIDRFDQQITDGQKASDIGAHYVDSRMVGFDTNCTFQIDLGEEDSKRICAIVARSLETYRDGVALAASARFSASVDGKKFKTLGTRPFTANGDLTVSEARIELPEVTDYRYIRVQIYKGNGHFFFTDEIEVYADVPAKEKEDSVAIAYANENIDRNAWQALSTGVPATPSETKILTVGSKYTFENCAFDERAPKNDTLLTDGARTAQYFSDLVWVGVKSDGDKAPNITLDIGKSHNNIYAFKVYALGGGVDVDYPDYIDVYGSDGGNYTFLGRMYAPSGGDSFTYTLLLPEYVEAKNIRFEFPVNQGNHWIEEIQVIAGYNEEQPDVLYPPINFPEVTEDIYWDSSEPDYKKEQNLLLGLTQQVSALFYADIDSHGDESPADDPCLTDGKRAQTSDEMYCYSDSWFFSRGGDGIEIFYDIGKLSTVSGVNLSFLEQESWGIIRPKFLSVFLSDDGENWYEVVDWYRGDLEKEDYYSDATHVELSFEFDKAYAARFVRFRVENGFIFIDELEAFGTKQVKSSATRLADSGIAPVPYYTNPESEAFASIENTPIKADDIVFVYGDRNKPEDLLPMVAYLDEEGNIKDTLMDGFIYCTHYNLPSGNQAHEPNYKEDWDYMLQYNYNGDISFAVLDEVVGQVKEALNIPDYKVQVYVTFLTLRESVTDFRADLDGDGVNEDLSTPEGRKNVIDWYIDENVRLFNEGNYKNLEFNGFYWVNESVIWEKDDSHIITEVAQYTHDKGHNILWVPYYKANRFFTGYELGFDVVSMQPNVVFTTDAPYWRFPSTAELTKARKMCVEIEHSYQCLGDPSFARSYMLYLYYGALTGYMEGINIYYDDVANISQMGYSDDALCRMQYDATYNYTLDKLDIAPDNREDYKISGKKDTVIDGDLNETDELQLFTLVSAPEHGYVTFNSDGSFRYFPDKGYTGTDSFTYTYNEFLGESDPCTVQITVE